VAKKILINAVTVGAHRYFAGDLLDASAEAATIAAVVDAGGQLLDEGDPVVDAAASVARQMRRSGFTAGLDAVLLAALAKSAHAAAQGGGGAGPQRDLYLNHYSSDSELVSISESTAENAGLASLLGEGLRSLIVVFPDPWAGGDIVLSGSARGGEQEETFEYPGAGGGAVVGSKVFSVLTTATNTAPAGAGAQSAEIQWGRRFGTTRAPVSAIEKVTYGGDIVTPAEVDLAEGWAELPGAVSQGVTVEICSTIA
jgi:hypothetical protein